MHKVFATKNSSLFMNVYLKLEPNNTVEKLIGDFNAYLNQQGFLSQYQITPFFPTHPLHITLYLTHYPQRNLSVIMHDLPLIAAQNKKIRLQSKDIEVSSSGYVLLSIRKNQELQKLSDHLVLKLMSLRDKKAPIPIWALQNPARVESFQHYGSPNVFRNFSPHLSLMVIDEQESYWHAQLNRLIQRFAVKKSIAVNTIATAIGIGIADAQGQIIKEIGSFPLS
ncbi:hypothetical protein EAW55_12540 [Legionella jordanis]|nr:hypothetical protein EAW55_12540 [Legionella jordanis]